MYVIELHDDDLGHEIYGSLTNHLGRDGTIEYDYQAEIHIQRVLDFPWRRAYLKTADKIKAIWERDPRTSAVRYLARADSYHGEWVLPFVGAPDARIAVGIWGHEITTDHEAEAWAAAQLRGAITAIVLDHGEIRAAWELIDGQPQLIARGPKSLV